MNTEILAGVDIGGTKCAISFGAETQEGNSLEILHKAQFPTVVEDGQASLQKIIGILDAELAAHPEWELVSIGISCGGPLNAQTGKLLGPPNLPNWVDFDVVGPLEARFKVPAALQNDADACALAEWRWGAGRGSRNMIYLTFGTGMGAGLILDGKLYTGAAGLAGEVGHVRMAPDGPIGHGKSGSLEGFCSGGGIAAQGREIGMKGEISARSIAEAAEAGNPKAKEIFLNVGSYLGKGIALLIDILNPELVVIGSIYLRQEHLLREEMLHMIRAEALPDSAEACRVVPAQLGELIGDYAALSVAAQAFAGQGALK